MRVMFVVSDYAGHYAPMVPLGWALQAAGHEVRLVCGPAHAPAASRSGITAVPRGTDVDTVVGARIGAYLEARGAGARHPDLPTLHPLTGEPLASTADFDWARYEPEYWRLAAETGRERTRAVAGFARSWRPDLVVYDLLSPEGLVAAHTASVPAVCHLWGPTGTDETDPAVRALRPDIPAPVRARLGIDPDADLIPYVIDPCPPRLAPATRAERLPVRYVPYSGPGTAAGPAPAAVSPDPIGDGTDGRGADRARGGARKRVALVWSNSLTRIFGEASFVVPHVVRAAADLGVELLLALGEQDAQRLGPVPRGTRLLGRYPLDLLLDRVDAVVHHGGAGCLMTAVAAGVPQLALPFGAEQELISGRLAAAGAGIALRGSRADAASVACALERLLDDPGYGGQARELAEHNAAAPSPAQLADTLVRIAAGATPAAPDPHRDPVPAGAGA